MMTSTGVDSQASATLRAAIRAAGEGLVERGTLVELVMLAAVAGEHLLVVGPPGTAKSAAVRRIADTLGGRYFEYLLGRFTEPSEIFGAIDLQRLREGEYHTNTAGMLPEADIAFLDEVFRGSTAILNTLLGVLNERRFRRGRTDVLCPLRVCIGATNEVPEDETLAAFADRFLVQVFLEPVADSALETLLAAGGAPAPRIEALASLADLDQLARAASCVDCTALRPELADAVRVLRGHDIELSDRRIVRVQRLMAAAAALDDREVADVRDLWPLLYAVPGGVAQSRARDLLRDRLERSSNAVLRLAAEQASAGPQLRARRIADDVRSLLAAGPQAKEDRSSLQLRIEGLLREIDAHFDVAALPPELGDLRVELVRHLEHGSTT